MYTEIAKQPHKQYEYRPFLPASERASYDALPSRVKEAAIKEAEAFEDFGFKPIPDEIYMEFSQNGNRSHFESLYFEKRHALNSLIVGECVEHKGRLLPAIVRGLNSLCDETGWQLPAHNSYERGARNLPLPDPEDPVIDLFAAETGAQLALSAYLLNKELAAFDPFISLRIRDELIKRIFEPYIQRHFWWMGRGDEPMNNWTVWCTQNVLLAVFLTDALFPAMPDICDMPFRDFKADVIEKACYSIDCFLKDYGWDGCCDEGPHYYRRSALCLFNATLVLDAVTGGLFAPVFNDPKIKNIATYIFNVHVDGRYYFNYADCSAVLDRAGAGEFLFAKAVDAPEMMRYAALDYQVGQEKKNEEEVSLFCRMQTLLASGEILAYDTSKPIVHSDICYESVGLFIARDPVFALAVKAGDNDDSHNHNDTGSITLYKKGHPVLVDVGVETYSAKTFSGSRYDIWTMQSAYHNLPTINGVMQHAGSEYGASDVVYSFSEDKAAIIMDIAGAYPSDAGISGFKREVTLMRGLEVRVKDSAIWTDDGRENGFSLSFMLCDKPEIDGNVVTLSDAAIRFDGEVEISCETIPVTDARLQWAWKGDLYRVIVTPVTPVISYVIS